MEWNGIDAYMHRGMHARFLITVAMYENIMKPSNTLISVGGRYFFAFHNATSFFGLHGWFSDGIFGSRGRAAFKFRSIMACHHFEMKITVIVM